jgi:hypothetical protein
MNWIGRGACAAIVLATIALTGACTTSGGGGGGTAFNWNGCYHSTSTAFPDFQIFHPLNQADNAIQFSSVDGSCSGSPFAATVISIVTPDQTLADAVCQTTYGGTGAFPLAFMARTDGTHLTNTTYWCDGAP